MSEPSKELTPIGQICKALDHMEGSLAESLKGTGISTGRFVATAKTAIQTHAQKDKLEKADRNSLYLAVKRAATDGLMPDGQEAALVIYNTKTTVNGKEQWLATVQYQPMVRGIVKLMRNSGEIDDVDAFVVHKNDKFSFKAGRDKMPEHDADWFGDRGEPIGAWAFVKLKNGEVRVTMLTKERILRIATRSKQAGNYSTSEGKDWEEFWKKAAIRNVSKLAPRSSQLDAALKEADKEFDFDADDIHLNAAPVNPISDKPKTETKAAAVIKGKAAEKAPEEKAPAQDPSAPPPVVDAEFQEYSEEEIPA